MENATKEKIITYLSEFITQNKQDKIDTALSLRTRYVTPVLEDIYQPHNASAVLRSAECMGVQDVHIIEKTNMFELKKNIALGSSKWISLFRHNQRGADNTTGCIEQLKQQGYRIIATTPHTSACMLDDLPLEGKMALLFGTEESGLSQTALDHADEFVKIPMYGFTESFNISVSVALSLFHITENLRHSSLPWQLTEDEKRNLKLEWFKKILPAGKQLEEQFL